MDFLKDPGFYIILFGNICNILTLIVLTRKKFKKFSARNILFSLTIADFFKQTSTFVFYQLGFNFKTMSELGCRVVCYLDSLTTAQSMYLMAYFSIDKFFFIKYPNNKLNRNLILFLIVCFVSIYSSTFAILVDVEKNSPVNNSSNFSSFKKNVSFNCLIPSNFSLTELISSLITPFMITFLFSCLLIQAICDSRVKLARLTSTQDKRRLKKDIKFAITTLTINVSYLLLNLPFFTLYSLQKTNSEPLLNKSFSYLHNISFSINFCILIISNSIFRKEFYYMCVCGRDAPDERRRRSTFPTTTWRRTQN